MTCFVGFSMVFQQIGKERWKRWERLMQVAKGRESGNLSLEQLCWKDSRWDPELHWRIHGDDPGVFCMCWEDFLESFTKMLRRFLGPFILKRACQFANVSVFESHLRILILRGGKLCVCANDKLFV